MSGPQEVTMSTFVLLLRDNPADFADLSPADMERIIAKYKGWAERLAADGRLVYSHKLRDDGGRCLATSNGRVTVSDGPYAEAREVVGGFFVVRADDYDAALALARECPHVSYGSIEVREVQPT